MNSCGEPGKDEFSSLIENGVGADQLAHAVLLLARDHYPRLNVSEYLEKIAEIASAVEPDMSTAGSAIDMVISINAIFFHEYGFRGNVTGYYDPRNSLLNEVINRRIGIPITLSIVYMEVARQKGLELHGVGMPGHFLVKHSDLTGEFFIDPFNSGRIMDYSSCSEFLSEISAGKIELTLQHVRAATTNEIIIRVLANLFGIYAKGSDYARAVWAADRILTVDPAAVSYLRDRGLLLAGLGKERQAIASLEAYLNVVPGADDEEQIKRQLSSLRVRLALQN